MTSGRKSLTAAVSAFWSKRSHKIGVTPAARSGSIFSGVRVIAATTCPSASMSGSKRLPITPVAPAKKIRILLPHIVLWLPLQRPPPLGRGAIARPKRRGARALQVARYQRADRAHRAGGREQQVYGQSTG